MVEAVCWIYWNRSSNSSNITSASKLVLFQRVGVTGNTLLNVEGD